MLFDSRLIVVYCLVIGFLSGTANAAYPENFIMVEQLEAAVIVDGSFGEWPATEASNNNHHNISEPHTIPSYVSNPQEMKYNKGWNPDPKIRAGVFDKTLYMSVTWKDEKPDELYRPWQNMGKHWRRGRKKDDMFAARFELNGELAACMLSGQTYSVDVWRWSAGRSNVEGYADDMTHKFSTEFQEKSAVYTHDGKSIYISTNIDQGTRGWSFTRKPKTTEGDIKTGITYRTPSGSLADVKAKGIWKDGQWTLELSRPLKTSDVDDAVFYAGLKINAQFAFFNAGYRLRKQITNSILFDFENIR